MRHSSQVAELPHGTITFLFTDIEGSTRLLKQLGERYGVARADHHRILRAAFEACDGQEIDTQGDAFFVAFRRARDAVAAAAAGQRDLAANEWPDGRELRVRMGMHTGEPSVSDEGYLGLGVHRAARICSAGHGGQVLLSEATVALLGDDEIPGIELRDLGRHQLKDIDRPERIHQLVLAGLPDSFPPLKAPQSQPDAATPFEGREGELAEAAQAAVTPPPWYRRRVGMAVIAGVILAALLAGGALLFAGGSNALARIDTDSAGLIDAKSNEIKKQVAVGVGPGAIAVGAGSIWVAAGDGTISRIDPKANLVTQTFPLDGTPSGIGFGDGAIWVTTNEDRSVRRISPAGNRIGEGIPVGNGPSGVAAGSGAVWVANRFDDTVSKIPEGEGATKVFRAGLTPSGVAVGEGAVWVSNEAAGTVSRLDPTSGALQTISVGNGPGGISVGEGAVWVANSIDGTLSRIDPANNSVAATISVGQGPSAVAVGMGAIWVTNRYDGTVSRIDAKTNRVTDTISVGESPGGIAATATGIWVSARAPLTAHRGGTLKLLGASEDIDTIDPAAAYAYASWDTLIMTNDGLLTFKRVPGADGNQLVPDLATSIPRSTDGGKTYTFQLRGGIRYSNGVELKASDFRRALERFFKIHLVPPFFQSVVGAHACMRTPPRCDLSRGVVADDSAGTVTFHLTEPDPELLYQLALPFADAVPAQTPAHLVTTHPIPATGPYMIARYVPNKRLNVVRNPHFREWSRAAQPDGFPDRIVLSLGARPDAQVTAIERGEADWAVSMVPPNRLDELTTKYTEQLHVETRPGTIYMFLNTRVRPFDRLAVRQALNYAVDRDAVIRLALGPRYLQPTCQILPPNFPGYRPYCPYTLNATKSGTWTAPDLTKARQLVSSSHTRGTKITVWAFPGVAGNGFPIRVGRYFVSLLKRLGYPASEKVLPAAGNSYFGAVSNSRTRAQIGFAAWAADYPAASAFINVLLTCKSFQPGTEAQVNIAEFCDPAIDAKIKRALAVQANDPAGAGALWADIDHSIVDRAPWVPTHTSKGLSFVSKRVGNYQYNPQWGVLLDQLWVR
jgi:YVTN family beta-propeller protein